MANGRWKGRRKREARVVTTERRKLGLLGAPASQASGFQAPGKQGFFHRAASSFSGAERLLPVDPSEPFLAETSVTTGTDRYPL